MCCSVLQCVAVYCSVLQRVAVYCSVLQRVAVSHKVVYNVLAARLSPLFELHFGPSSLAYVGLAGCGSGIVVSGLSSVHSRRTPYVSTYTALLPM